MQRYGKRAPGLDSTKRVNKATFMHQIMEKQQAAQQQQMYQQQQQQQQIVDPVREEPNQEENDNRPNQIPDGGIGDDESAATEEANAPGPDGGPSDDEWVGIIDALWLEYDKDNSGYLDR